MAAAAVTPSDSVDIATGITRALYVGTAGTLVVDTYTNTSVTFVGVLGGTVLPIQVRRVRVTGTTATNIVALY